MPLDQWLKLICKPSPNKPVMDYQFPTKRHRQQYLKSVGERTDEEIFCLLRKLLIPSGTLGIDKWHFASMQAAQQSAPDMHERMMNSEYFRRLSAFYGGISTQPPWEGNFWILDLLPHFPKQALEGLHAYFLAHAQMLPDGRLTGLWDAIEVIRAKYIGIPGTDSEKLQFLLQLNWRGFECLVERLYESMGFKTKLTAPQKDGGRDILAARKDPGGRLELRIECKLYVEEPIGLAVIQRLLGVVADEKVNKGVLVTTSRFTKPARDFAKKNPRLELLNGNQLMLLMNEHLGSSWPLHIDRLIAESEQAST